MAELQSNSAAGANCFKEAVCINAGRIYDSCSDRDCLENIEVQFTDTTQPLIDQAINIKCKDVEIKDVCINVEEVPFNKGFFSVDITFFFNVKLLVFTSPACSPTTVCGVATFQKKVILFGSEGNVKIFSSDCSGPTDTSGLPTASVQAVKPICLSVKLCDCHHSHHTCTVPIPEHICSCYDGCFCCCPCEKQVLITLGLFTIVQIERMVQIMIPSYDFCVPDKCTGVKQSAEDPCELFSQIKFPTDAFFPPRMNDNSSQECHNGM